MLCRTRENLVFNKEADGQVVWKETLGLHLHTAELVDSGPGV